MKIISLENIQYFGLPANFEDWIHNKFIILHPHLPGVNKFRYHLNCNGPLVLLKLWVTGEAGGRPLTWSMSSAQGTWSLETPCLSWYVPQADKRNRLDTTQQINFIQKSLTHCGLGCHVVAQNCTNVGLSNGLLTDNTKSLPEPMLINHQCGPVTFIRRRIHKGWYLSHQSPTLAWKLFF